MPDLLTSLAAHARRTPDRAAIVAPDGNSTTWAELHAEVGSHAADLRRAGGTHVVVALTGAESLVAYLAVQAAGLVPVLVGPNAASLIPTLQRYFNVRTTIRTPLGSVAKASVGFPERMDDTVGAIQFSTGSTGTPKGMIRTVGAEYFDALGRCLAMGLRPGDSWLSIQAANPNIALGAFRCVLLLGGTLLLTDSTTPEALSQRAQGGMNVLALQSHDWRRAVAAEIVPHLIENGLRVAAITGGNADPRTLKRLDKLMLGHGNVLNVYGLTETGTVAVADRLDRERGGPCTVGALVPTLHADLVPTGIPGRGQIQLRGPAVAERYLLAGPDGLREESATVDGWLPTGDAGRFGVPGDLEMFGRLRDAIEVGGQRMLPRELEITIEKELSADEVVVLPYRDGAVVVIAGATDPVRDALSDFSHVLVLDELPRNAGGKTDRAALSASLAAGVLNPLPLHPLERSVP